MNKRQDEQLEPLLAQAIGDAEPAADLVDRICELTDGTLCDALDRAIGPDSVTYDHDKLVQRILAATSERPAVAGRIGFFGAAWRVAALIAVAGGIYLIAMGLTPSSSQQTTHPQLAAVTPAVNASSDASLAEIEQAVQAFSSDTDWAFDQRVATLRAGMDQVADERVWADSPDALVERAAETADWYDATGSSTGAWF